MVLHVPSSFVIYSVVEIVGLWRLFLYCLLVLLLGSRQIGSLDLERMHDRYISDLIISFSLSHCPSAST